MTATRSTTPIPMLALVIALGCAGPQPGADVADTVYTNGRIYTVDETQTWAEAVAIKDGRFIAVGSAMDVDAVTGDTTEIVDLEGAYLQDFDLLQGGMNWGQTVFKRAIT